MTVSVVDLERTDTDVQFKRYRKKILIGERELAKMDLHEDQHPRIDYYSLIWPTELGPEDAIREINRFFSDIYSNYYEGLFGHDDKDQDVIFGNRAPTLRMTYDDFLHHIDDVIQYYQQVEATMIRANGPFGDLEYDSRGNPMLMFISHIDFSDVNRLPYLLRKTHSTPIPYSVLPELSSELRQQIGKYGGRKLQMAI